MRSKIFYGLVTAGWLLTGGLNAQIDSLIVEKYYISDLKDETNSTGGVLPEGSVTYRIYVDLSPGSRLLKIFGEAGHPIRISSTHDFFNNTDRGKSLGREIKVNRLDENTVALDSWITIGLATESHYGVIKSEDTDNSIVGGINNDGGSAAIPSGLLTNTAEEAGIAVTTADGLATAPIYPSNWIAQLNGSTLNSSSDTTIFGNLIKGHHFISFNFSLSNSGTEGVTSGNRVLIGQLTTKGELSYKFNLEVEESNGVNKKIVRYVADNPGVDDKTSRYLTYPVPPLPPPVCGCTDPDYLEYRKDNDLHSQDSCKTRIVFGCTDPLACNFDPEANFNIPELCCYPGRCNNRDIKIVCPDIHGLILGFSIYPNPVNDNLTMEITNGNNKQANIIIYDTYGSLVMIENLGTLEDSMTYRLNLSCLAKGFYLISLHYDNKILTKSFIKN